MCKRTNKFASLYEPRYSVLHIHKFDKTTWCCDDSGLDFGDFDQRSVALLWKAHFSFAEIWL